MPARVPVRDPDNWFSLSRGEGRVGFENVSQIMRMWINGKNVGIPRQLEIVADGEVADAGRDVQCAIVFQLNQQGKFDWFFASEIEPDSWPDGLNFAVWPHVYVQD